MNKKSLSSLLRSLDSPNWSERTIDGTCKVIKWLPVIKLGNQNFGITVEGDWCGEFSDNQRICSGTFYTAFLTVLERSRAEIIELFQTAIKSAGLPKNVIKTFPFDEVLLEALNSTQYWSSLADSWLDNGYPISPEIALSFPGHKMVLRWHKERMDKIIYA